MNIYLKTDYINNYEYNYIFIYQNIIINIF